MKIWIGNAVFPNEIRPDWVIGVENGEIAVSAPADAEAGTLLTALPEDVVTRLPDRILIAPAFVDIHCHAGDGIFAYENPLAVMRFHRAHGTASMLLTLYRDIGFDGMKQGIEKISSAMKEDRGILGIHLEGPYLNPAYGSKSCGTVDVPDPNAYRALMCSGRVKMWTFAPEVPGTDAFCREIAQAGVIPAIGHSAADVIAVRSAVNAGARVVTHIFNASGLTNGELTFRGTRNLGFDEACMLENGLYYEVINDSRGIHVRHEMIRLLEKTVGKRRIVAITDCFGGKQDSGGDVNIQGGEIAGSRMTMLDAARNFLSMGYPLTDVFRFTAYQPALAIHEERRVGSLLLHRRADFLLTDSSLKSLSLVSAEGVETTLLR